MPGDRVDVNALVERVEFALGNYAMSAWVRDLLTDLAAALTASQATTKELAEDIDRLIDLNARNLGEITKAQEREKAAYARGLIEETERALVVSLIASMLDFPSIYMGGPSKNALRKAGKVVDMLERSKRLHATECDHSSWKSYHENGEYCPACSSHIELKEDAQ